MCRFLSARKTQVRFGSNASTFDMKRKCVLPKTQVRFNSNALAFSFKRKCVFSGILNENLL